MVNYQSYVGSSAPITFGLVRHYDMRGQSNTADIQVNLLHKEDRDNQSHDVAKTFVPEIQKKLRKIQCQCKNCGSSTWSASFINDCCRNLWP